MSSRHTVWSAGAEPSLGSRAVSPPPPRPELGGPGVWLWDPVRPPLFPLPHPAKDTGSVVAEAPAGVLSYKGGAWVVTRSLRASVSLLSSGDPSGPDGTVGGPAHAARAPGTCRQPRGAEDSRRQSPGPAEVVFLCILFTPQPLALGDTRGHLCPGPTGESPPVWPGF